MDINNLQPGDVEKVIRKLAMTMPKAVQAKSKLQPLSGKQLIRRGIKKDKEGKDIVPQGTYMVKVMVKEKVSHSKNMKKLYKSDGMEGVVHYVNSVKSWVEEANKREKQKQDA